MKSPLRWIGGKSKLYNKIISIMPEHKCYVEPFAGGLWILLNKPKARVEVANDINKELVNFYRVLQNNYNELKEKFKFAISSREIFDEYLNMTACEIIKMSNVDRATRFLYLNRCSYSGRMTSYGFSNSRRSNLCTITDDFDEIIRQVHYRIKDIYIECGDYQKLVKRYDKRLDAKEKQSILFYFDPPYDGVYDYEGNSINYEDFSRALYTMKSNWILSVNDTEYVRSLFSQYTMLEVNVTETIASSGSDVAIRNELIIINYELSQIPDWASIINTTN